MEGHRQIPTDLNYQPIPHALPGKFQPVVSPWVTIILTFEGLNFEEFMPSKDRMKQSEFLPVYEPFPPPCQHRSCSDFRLSLVEICCTAHQIWTHKNQLYCCIYYSTIHPKVWHNSNLSQVSTYPTHPGLLPRETHIPERRRVDSCWILYNFD